MCPDLAKVSPDAVAEMQAALRNAFRREGMPTSVSLDVTYRCELDCQHCYLDDRSHYPELNPTELRNLLEQLHACGVLDLRWSGGEVFLRPDFEDAIDLAARLGFQNRIKTHAGNITPERATFLAARRVRQVDVSIYSLRPDVHDAFTRRPGSLERTQAGIGCLRAAGVAVRVSVSVQEGTVDEIPALHAWAVGLGCTIKFSTVLFRDHNASERNDHLDLSLQARQAAEALIWQVSPSVVPSPIADRPGSEPCGAGRTLAYIAPDGGVWPCVMFPLPLGNLREKPFRDIWLQSSARADLASWTNDDRAGCQTCGGSGACFYCPGEAFKNTGDFRKAPPSFHARTRARMAGLEAAGADAFTPGQWASVPEGGASPPRPGRFVFPIARKQKGDGRRVLR